MIEMKNLSFGYRKQPNLFEQLQLSIPQGSIYGLLGKNGAGKTTLLRLLAGLLFPASGSIEVFGYNPADRLPSFLADLFFVPEELYLPNMTIGQYLTTYAPFYPRFDFAAFDGFIREFDLEHNWKLNKISHGQKKKAMLSFGLASHTKLLIMDEPTNGLDIPSKSQFRSLIARSITEDRTFIVSTHQVRDMANLIDPVIILDQGKIIFQQSLEAVSKHIHFQLQFAEPDPKEVLHAERVPGGYLTLSHKQGDEDSDGEIDIEALFNAVTDHPTQFANIFKKTVVHEHQ